MMEEAPAKEENVEVETAAKIAAFKAKKKHLKSKQKQKGPAPFASFEDLSDEIQSSPEEKSNSCLPEIQEEGGEKKPTFQAHSPPRVSSAQTPRIKVLHASSSSQHDSEVESRSSTPEHLAVCTLGFREEGTEDLRSSTEEMDFLGGEEAKPKHKKHKRPKGARQEFDTKSENELFVPIERERKDSQSSIWSDGLIITSGRNSRMSSVGSITPDRRSPSISIGRSPSPHKLLLETSFCGNKPIATKSMEVENYSPTESPSKKKAQQKTSQLKDTNALVLENRNIICTKAEVLATTQDYTQSSLAYQTSLPAPVVSGVSKSAPHSPQVASKGVSNMDEITSIGLKTEDGTQRAANGDSLSRPLSVSTKSLNKSEVTTPRQAQPVVSPESAKSPKIRRKSSFTKLLKDVKVGIKGKGKEEDAKSKKKGFPNIFKKKDKKKGCESSKSPCSEQAVVGSSDPLARVEFKFTNEKLNEQAMKNAKPDSSPMKDTKTVVERKDVALGPMVPGSEALKDNAIPHAQTDKMSPKSEEKPITSPHADMSSEPDTSYNVLEDARSTDDAIESASKEKSQVEVKISEAEEKQPGPLQVDAACSPLTVDSSFDDAALHVPEKEFDDRSSESDMSIVGYGSGKKLTKQEAIESDHEEKNLVSQESNEDGELPFVPTTLPQERSQVVPLVPVKQRTIDMVTKSVNRPRGTTPRNPCTLESFQIQQKAGEEEKIKVKLPSQPSVEKSESMKQWKASKNWADFCEEGLKSPRMYKKDANTPSTPPPQDTESSEQAVPEMPQVPPSSWVNLEELPEKVKVPKKIRTVVTRDTYKEVQKNTFHSSSSKEDSVSRSECSCECHLEYESLDGSEHSKDASTKKVVVAKIRVSEQSSGSTDSCDCECHGDASCKDMQYLAVARAGTERGSSHSDSSFEDIGYGEPDQETVPLVHDSLDPVKPFCMDLDVTSVNSERSSVYSLQDESETQSPEENAYSAGAL